MLPATDIQLYMAGAWRMMTGRRDGLRMLDISGDGFWNSFHAILVAAPIMFVGWVPLANEIMGPDARFAERAFCVIRLALVDIGSWVLPLAALVAFAGPLGVRDRVVHYVVASNWGSAVLVWFMLPASLMRLVWPDARDMAIAISLGIFLATLVLSWRLTNVAIDKGPGLATGVFTGMLFASIFTLFSLQKILGVSIQ